METDDAWARDVGPTFVINGRGERRGIDWGFNAWGWRCGRPVSSGEGQPRGAQVLATWSATTYTINAISFARAAPSTRTARAPRSSPKPAC
ncbi:MAG: agmatine deiminase family protein [Butyricicoccus sp.]